jgi:hypothetical protein
MSDDRRMTIKRMAISDLIHWFPESNPNSKCTLLEGVDILIDNDLPLPPIYITQTKDGRYELLGQYSHNLIHFIHYWHSGEMKHNRRYREVMAIIFEWCPKQDELIYQYMDLGFIKL